jgi:hypothetical protein
MTPSPSHLLLLLALVGCDRPGTTPPSAAPQATDRVPGRPSNSGHAGLGDPLVVEGELRIDPPLLVVDDVSQCADRSIHVVRVHNDGANDETILRTISSCGCARVELEPNTVVPAGKSVEIPISFKAWGAARRKAHDVRFILSDNRLGPLLSMDVEITSPLRTIPSAAQQALRPDGRVRIVADDEQPFSIIALDPPIPAAIPEGRDGVREIVIDWAALGAWSESPDARSDPRVLLAEDGSWDRMQIEVLTDHPDCARLQLDLYSPRHTAPVWNR